MTGSRKRARDGAPAKRRGGPKRSAAAKRAAKRPARSVKKRADEAAKKAKAQGATGKLLGAVKQSYRDSAIVARAAQGLPNAVIAAEFEVSPRTVERVRKQAREMLPSPFDAVPMQILEDAARGFGLSIGDLEAIAAAAMKDGDLSSAIRAKRGANEARGLHLQLMGTVGKLPTNLELFRSEAEMIRIAEKMVDALNAVEAGEMTIEQARQVFADAISRPHDTPALPAG